MPLSLGTRNVHRGGERYYNARGARPAPRPALADKKKQKEKMRVERPPGPAKIPVLGTGGHCALPPTNRARAHFPRNVIP